MTAIDSYHDLTEKGFNFWLEQGALKCHAPKGKMTADILAWLKASKKELISLLAKTKHYEKIAVSEVCPKLDVPIPDTKSAVENIGPNIEGGQLSPNEGSYTDLAHGQIRALNHLPTMRAFNPYWLLQGQTTT